MTTEELVKQICKEQGISVAKLAAALGQSRQNFYKKLQRDTLTAQEWQEASNSTGSVISWKATTNTNNRIPISSNPDHPRISPSTMIGQESREPILANGTEKERSFNGAYPSWCWIACPHSWAATPIAATEVDPYTESDRRRTFSFGE